MRLRAERRFRLIFVAGLAFCAGGAVASVAALQSGSSDATSLTRRLDELTREKKRVQQELRGVKQRQHHVTSQLTALDRKLDRTETRLHRTRQSINHTRSELQQANQDYEASAARLAKQRVSLSERLVAVYERGQVQPLEVLLESTGFADFANRLYLLNQVITHDAELLAEFEQSRDEADGRRSELEKQESELAALRKRLSLDRRRASAKRKVTEQEKKGLLRDRAAWERALAELEESSREVQGMLQRLQQTPAGQARLAKPWTEGLAWPLRGRISSSFGYRRHPIYRVRKMHTGLDIAAPRGKAIRAAAGGTVVHAARWGGYGNCVIIDHGGGLATLYAHCSRLAVKKDQKVEQGATVAYVGSTGLSTGPHLHLETRRDGRPVDPTPFLK